jgi:hypothetical protein
MSSSMLSGRSRPLIRDGRSIVTEHRKKLPQPKTLCHFPLSSSISVERRKREAVSRRGLGPYAPATGAVPTDAGVHEMVQV